jgi:hypothetical protein
LIAASLGATIDSTRSPAPARRLWQPTAAEIGAFWCIMAAETKTESRRARHGYFNGYRFSAWIAHFFSWLTTYWLIEWITDPHNDTNRAIAIVVSIALEFLLHKAKKLLFDEERHNDGIGWGAFVADSIINAGGVYPKAGRFAAWPPLAALVGAFGVDIAKKDSPGNVIAAFILSLLVGMGLSLLPIRLSKAADST